MNQNLKNGVAAQGFDVVSFFNKNPSKGTSNYISNYNEAEYHSASSWDFLKINIPEVLNIGARGRVAKASSCLDFDRRYI